MGSPREMNAEESIRIVLIDHSSTRDSVVGFRLAFEVLIVRAKTKKMIKMNRAEKPLRLEIVLINIIDSSQNSGLRFTVKDLEIDKITDLKKILGGHP